MFSKPIHRSIVIMTCCSALGACSPRAETEPRAKLMEAVFAPVLPKQLGQGVVLQSAVAEGDILVMTVGGPSDWTQGWSQAEMSKMVAAGFCHVKTTEGYFEGGGKIRFDISEGGNPPVEGQVLDHCPEA